MHFLIDVSDAVLQDCASGYMPGFAATLPAHHGWGCLSLAEHGIRRTPDTGDAEPENTRHRHRQEGDSRGAKPARFCWQMVSWMMTGPPVTFLLPLFAVFSSLGFGHFFPYDFTEELAEHSSLLKEQPNCLTVFLEKETKSCPEILEIPRGSCEGLGLRDWSPLRKLSPQRPCQSSPFGFTCSS